LTTMTRLNDDSDEKPLSSLALWSSPQLGYLLGRLSGILVLHQQPSGIRRRGRPPSARIQLTPRLRRSYRELPCLAPVTSRVVPYIVQIRRSVVVPHFSLWCGWCGVVWWWRCRRSGDGAPVLMKWGGSERWLAERAGAFGTGVECGGSAARCDGWRQIFSAASPRLESVPSIPVKQEMGLGF
jgi:hypothetical protein